MSTQTVVVVPGAPVAPVTVIVDGPAPSPPAPVPVLPVQEEVGVVVVPIGGKPGEPGAPGPAGPPGPTGPSGGGADFLYADDLPRTVHTIPHGLGFDPAGITVHDDEGYQLEGWSVQYTVPGSELRIAFDIPSAVRVRLS